MNAADYCVFQT